MTCGCPDSRPGRRDLAEEPPLVTLAEQSPVIDLDGYLAAHRLLPAPATSACLKLILVRRGVPAEELIVPLHGGDVRGGGPPDIGKGRVFFIVQEDQAGFLLGLLGGPVGTEPVKDAHNRLPG
jgi:hypothetical protein